MEELRFSEYCANCRKSLEDLERVLFVEKEVGRCFCSEECIKDYFQPTVQYMEEELLKLRSNQDFNEEEVQKLSHYQLVTLEDPDEVWVDETDAGERHFTFISHFRHGEEFFNYIVVCLTLDSEPSFVFLSFPTRDDDLVDHYRKGMDLRINDDLEQNAGELSGQFSEQLSGQSPTEESTTEQLSTLDEGLIHLFRDKDSQDKKPALSELERLYLERRQAQDIPLQDFRGFEKFIEPTLDEPEEVWRVSDRDGRDWLVFLAMHFDLAERPFEMIVICQAPSLKSRPQTDIRLEPSFAFPTIDPMLVQFFRKGIPSFNVALRVVGTWGRAA